MTDTIAKSMVPLFVRDLKKWKDEIALFKDEANIWKTIPGTTNSCGNLTLHIWGNLNHFVGVVLGKTGYIRNRENEFKLKNVPKEDLLAKIDSTIKMMEEILETINEEIWASTYPHEVFGYSMETGFFLIHLYGHLNYHLGQVNYLRRGLDL